MPVDATCLPSLLQHQSTSQHTAMADAAAQHSTAHEPTVAHGTQQSQTQDCYQLSWKFWCAYIGARRDFIPLAPCPHSAHWPPPWHHQ